MTQNQNYQNYSNNAGGNLELTFIQQSIAFSYSLLLGIILGIVYEVFKIIRLALCSNKYSVFIVDIIYMLIASLSLFVFSIAFLQGYTRIYLILGSFFGLFVFKITIGRLFSKIYCPIILIIKNSSHKFQLIFKKITKKLLKSGHKILYNISSRISIFRHKFLKTATDKRVMASDEKRKAKCRKNYCNSESERK